MKNELLQSVGQIWRNITITFSNCLRKFFASSSAAQVSGEFNLEKEQLGI